MAAFKDITGARFGRLVAVKCLQRGRQPGASGPVLWLCKCDCGTFVSAKPDSLNKGEKKSCGCLRDEATHGGSNTSLYSTWNGIKNRCFNKEAINYKDYGARGITMHKPWSESFSAFRDYILLTIGNKPSEDYSLDRKDSSKHYAPGNIRWATRTQQNNNSRRNLVITHCGLTMTLSEWCSYLNIGYRKTYERLYKLGWSTDKALGTLKMPS